MQIESCRTTIKTPTCRRTCTEKNDLALSDKQKLSLVSMIDIDAILYILHRLISYASGNLRDITDVIHLHIVSGRKYASHYSLDSNWILGGNMISK